MAQVPLDPEGGPPPDWMNEEQSLSMSRPRRGATPNPRSGLHTALFVVGLVAAVGVAGVIGVVVWGPERAPTAHSHLASEPSAVPSASAEPAVEPSAEPEPPPAASTPAVKKKRRKKS